MTPRRTTGRAALALALLPALALPPTAHAAPAEQQPIRADLSIEATLRDPKSTLPERIRVRGEALLRDNEVLPARGAQDPRIVIAIEPLSGAQGYRCRFGAWRGEQAIEGTDGVSLCELCTEGELVEHVGAAITRVVGQLPRAQGEAPPPGDGTPPDPEPPRRRGGVASLRGAGIGLTVGGGVALGVGIPLAASRARAAQGGGESAAATDTRPAG
ncbi:MAG: hypothetical protein K1X88_31190, partial [Nannocystaceae bacterium]|nr:hypothetical protein [Nannocystaceae bacterium]